MNSDFYNVTRNSKKNERDIMEKIKMFQKKEVEGKLRPFMIPRYDEAKQLLSKLYNLKGVEAPAKPKVAHIPGNRGWMYGIGQDPPAPVTTARLPEATARLPEATKANTMTLKRRSKKQTQWTQPEFNPPPINQPSKPVPYGVYNRSGEFHIEGLRSPVTSSPSGTAPVNNISRFGLTRSRKEKAVTVDKRRLKINNEVMPYLEEASKKFLPLPELYNPFTGVKYGPEENPQPDIDRAHKMLNDILAKAIRRAHTLKKRAMKAKKID